MLHFISACIVWFVVEKLQKYILIKNNLNVYLKEFKRIPNVTLVITKVLSHTTHFMHNNSFVVLAVNDIKFSLGSCFVQGVNLSFGNLNENARGSKHFIIRLLPNFILQQETVNGLYKKKKRNG